MNATNSAGRRALIKRGLTVAKIDHNPQADDETLAKLARKHPKAMAAAIARVFDRAADSWVEGNNSGNEQTNKEKQADCERLHRQAESVLELFGVECDYPGLYPCYKLDGREYLHPDLERLLTHAAKPKLQRRLQDALGLRDDDFAYHATDLYVVWSPEVWDWLRENYEYFANVDKFQGQHGAKWNGAGRTCIDVPFAGYPHGYEF